MGQQPMHVTVFGKELLVKGGISPLEAAAFQSQIKCLMETESNLIGLQRREAGVLTAKAGQEIRQTTADRMLQRFDQITQVSGDQPPTFNELVQELLRRHIDWMNRQQGEKKQWVRQINRLDWLRPSIN